MQMHTNIFNKIQKQTKTPNHQFSVTASPTVVAKSIPGVSRRGRGYTLDKSVHHSETSNHIHTDLEF